VIDFRPFLQFSSLNFPLVYQNRKLTAKDRRVRSELPNGTALEGDTADSELESQHSPEQFKPMSAQRVNIQTATIRRAQQTLNHALPLLITKARVKRKCCERRNTFNKDHMPGFCLGKNQPFSAVQRCNCCTSL
jgi:hypothetical protein